MQTGDGGGSGKRKSFGRKIAKVVPVFDIGRKRLAKSGTLLDL